MPVIRLGLIGDNIAASRAPELHRAAGALCGIEIRYDLLVPKALQLDFDAVFDRAYGKGYRGLNITYPYKERVMRRVVSDPHLRALGACNTALFDGATAAGANTDYTGFQRAFRARFGSSSPGVVTIAGCGGAGRAIAFALADLGAKALRLFDQERTKVVGLQDSIRAIHPDLDVLAASSVVDACDGADGLVNATPLGMVGIGGNAFPSSVLPGRAWAFDAVYTPVDTPFLLGARARGLAAMSGFELYFYQGVDAFKLFTQRDVDVDALRAELARQSS